MMLAPMALVLAVGNTSITIVVTPEKEQVPIRVEAAVNQPTRLFFPDRIQKVTPRPATAIEILESLGVEAFDAPDKDGHAVAILLLQPSHYPATGKVRVELRSRRVLTFVVEAIKQGGPLEVNMTFSGDPRAPRPGAGSLAVGSPPPVAATTPARTRPAAAPAAVPLAQPPAEVAMGAGKATTPPSGEAQREVPAPKPSTATVVAASAPAPPSRIETQIGSVAFGSVALSSKPASDVTLDAKPVGRISDAALSLPLIAGPHTLVFTHPKYRPFTRVFTVQAGQQIRVRVDWSLVGIPPAKK